jgi:Zn-finger in ubiquitin-hydrolases and other protein
MTPDGRVVWMAEVREINPEVPPSGEGCAECLAADPPGWWFHLRRCATCGRIGCCDSSPSQHARAHFHATDHRYVQSFEPGEDWFWDFQTDEYAAGPQLAPPRHHPEDQPTPGPAGAVPQDWTQRLH